MKRPSTISREKCGVAVSSAPGRHLRFPPQCHGISALPKVLRVGPVTGLRCGPPDFPIGESECAFCASIPAGLAPALPASTPYAETIVVLNAVAPGDEKAVVSDQWRARREKEPAALRPSSGSSRCPSPRHSGQAGCTKWGAALSASTDQDSLSPDSPGGHRIRTRDGWTITTQRANRRTSVRPRNSWTKRLTASGPSLPGRNRTIPGWLPGGYFLRLPNSTSRVNSTRSSRRAAAATSWSDRASRSSSATVAASCPKEETISFRCRERFSSNLNFMMLR